MSTTAEIQAATALTVRELTKAGIKVRAYAKNPLSGGNATFSIALDPKNELRIWNGEAKVTVVPSTERALRQVVLKVHEKSRTITKVHKLNWTEWDRGATLEDFRQHHQVSDWWIQRNLGVTLPPGAEYSVTTLDRVEKPQKTTSGVNPDYGTATLQGKIKATRQNFLVGRDEKSQFISALPRQCSSVADAHDALRPAGVPRGAPRQGEWFFVAATPAERKAIEASIKARGSAGIIARNPWGSDNIQRNRVGQLEMGSSHRAPCSIIIKSRRYACGLVYDIRPDRHGSLMLSGWHKVVRNREVTSSATQNVARFD